MLAAALEHELETRGPPELETRRRPPKPEEIKLIAQDLDEVRLKGLWSSFQDDDTLLRKRVRCYFEHVVVKNAETIIDGSQQEPARTPRGDLVALDDTALLAPFSAKEVISDAVIADAPSGRSRTS